MVSWEEFEHGNPKQSRSSRGRAAESSITSRFFKEKVQSKSQYDSTSKTVRFGKWENGEMNAASMVTLNSKYTSVRVACNPACSRGLFGASGVLLPPRANQAINLYASLVLMVRSRRGGRVVGNCEAVGGELCTRSQTRRFLSLRMWFTAASVRDMGISNILSESPHRWTMADTLSLKQSTASKLKSMVNS